MAKKQEKKKENKFKDLANNPKILLTFLSVICVILLLYCFKLKNVIENNGKIMVGTIEEEELYVPNIHYLTNDKVNYFYADSAATLKTDLIYTYDFGYYVKNDKGEYLRLASRNGKIDDPLAFNVVVGDLTAWNFAELDEQDAFFTKENKKYLKDLYLILKASTKKDSLDYDINLEYKVNVVSLTSKE